MLLDLLRLNPKPRVGSLVLYTSISSVKALVRWATGKRLTNRLPNLSFITPTLTEKLEGRILTEAVAHAVVVGHPDGDALYGRHAFFVRHHSVIAVGTTIHTQCKKKTAHLDQTLFYCQTFPRNPTDCIGYTVIQCNIFC